LDQAGRRAGETPEVRVPKGCGGASVALQTRERNGRTWFSVKDPTGRFADNEGHLEFDVAVK
jgi:hypothetical protein